MISDGFKEISLLKVFIISTLFDLESILLKTLIYSSKIKLSSVFIDIAFS